MSADIGGPAAATAAVPLRQQGLAVEDTVADIADLQKVDVAAAAVVEIVLGQVVVVVVEAFAADIEVHAVDTEVLVVVDIEVPAADTEGALLRFLALWAALWAARAVRPHCNSTAQDQTWTRVIDE